MEITIKIEQDRIGIQFSGLQVILSPNELKEDSKQLEEILSYILSKTSADRQNLDAQSVSTITDTFISIGMRLFECVEINEQISLSFELDDKFELKISIDNVLGYINIPAFMDLHKDFNEAIEEVKKMFSKTKDSVPKWMLYFDENNEDQEEDVLPKDFTNPLKKRRDPGMIEIQFDERPTVRQLAYKIAKPFDRVLQYVALIRSNNGQRKVTVAAESTLKAHEVYKICLAYNLKANINFADSIL